MCKEVSIIAILSIYVSVISNGLNPTRQEKLRFLMF